MNKFNIVLILAIMGLTFFTTMQEVRQNALVKLSLKQTEAIIGQHEIIKAMDTNIVILVNRVIKLEDAK